MGVGISVSHIDRNELKIALEKLKNDKQMRNLISIKCREVKTDMMEKSSEKMVSLIQEEID